MISGELILISTSLVSNSIGVKTEIRTQKLIPIIKVEDIYAREFYEAGERGYKPDLRVRISELNYENERELIYRGEEYTIIRKQEMSLDEIILVCERKVKNVK